MKKSREELEKECAEAAAKAEQYQHQAQRLENRYYDYQESKRKKRNHRLITRGADVESVAPEVRRAKQPLEFWWSKSFPCRKSPPW